MDCRLEWALRALYTALQWPPPRAPRRARPGKGPRERPQSAGADVAPELLAQPARKSRELVLTVADFTARKVPAPGQVLARRSLRDEHAPALIVERRRHHQDRRAAHQLRGARIRARLAEVRELAVTVLVLLA